MRENGGPKEFVISAQAGIHFCPHISVGARIDSRLRGNDKFSGQNFPGISAYADKRDEGRSFL